MILKICLIIFACICLIGIGLCIGIFLCTLAIDDLIPPAFPNYWKGQEAKRKMENKNDK